MDFDVHYDSGIVQDLSDYSYLIRRRITNEAGQSAIEDGEEVVRQRHVDVALKKLGLYDLILDELRRGIQI